MEATYRCLNCELYVHTNKHYCTRECRTEGDKVLHFDFCQKCHKNLLVRFELQLRQKELPPFNPPRKVDGDEEA